MYGHSGNKHPNLKKLKFDVKFCDIKADDFQATFLSILI